MPMYEPVDTGQHSMSGTTPIKAQEVGGVSYHDDGSRGRRNGGVLKP